MILTLADT